jgi:hypothetical protein
VNYLTTVHRFLNDAAERGRIGRPSDECRLKLVILAGRRVGNVHKRIASVEEIFELQRVAEMKRVEQEYLC